MDNKKVKLPSGAELEITIGSFAESKALYVAMMKEIKSLKVDASQDIDHNFLKDLFCAGFSSSEIDACLEVLMKRCTYGGIKITKDSFEEVDKRQDYMLVCFEVASANVAPFTKGLFAEFSALVAKVKALLK